MKLLDWLDDRTGFRDLVHEALYERIPGGARWRYVWGSTLVFTFSVQVITGIFLVDGLQPQRPDRLGERGSTSSTRCSGGWLLRGMHHFTAQAMVVLLVLHLMQVVIDGAYRAPREVNFWLGLILMQIVLGPVAHRLSAPLGSERLLGHARGDEPDGPGAGRRRQLQQLVVGGADYGHYTLTRFFALHAGVLPGLLVFFLVLHVAIFRRHGIHAKQPTAAARLRLLARPGAQRRRGLPGGAVRGAVLHLAGHHRSERASRAAWAILGPSWARPADPADQYSAARPEWYFLFLFQFLKYFPGRPNSSGRWSCPAW